MTKDELQVGQCYRAKKPAEVVGLVNDRVITWIGEEKVQYDSPSVPLGRRLPQVTIEQFLKWASHNVTKELLPTGEWEQWAVYQSLKFLKQEKKG